MLTIADVEPFLAHCEASAAESGRDGDPYFGPYSRNDPFPIDDIRPLTHERWTKSLDQPGWRRAWGAFDGERIVASGNVAGGDIPADLHRVNLGMGVLRSYRRRGLGREILQEIVNWCKTEPAIHWLDLGVFANNLPAKALYGRFGFRVIGTTCERWFVDGHPIDEISMTLEVTNRR
jgi:RimJ/RimL family protein N-acetyltransferase